MSDPSQATKPAKPAKTSPAAIYTLERGMESIPVECDCFRLRVGKVWVKLQYRKSDGEISINASGSLSLRPVASNVIRLDISK